MNTYRSTKAKYKAAISSIIYVLSFTLLLTLWPSLSLAAANSLPALLNKASTHISVFKNEKHSIVQTLSYNKSQPHRITIKRTTTHNKKGSAKEESWVFNLADINANLIRHETSKKYLKLLLPSTDTLKTIQHNKSNGSKKFVNKTNIIVNDMDDMRAIKKLFIAAVPLAQISWKKSLSGILKNTQTMRKALTGAKVDIALKNKTLSQKISRSKAAADILVVTLTTTSSKNTEVITQQWSMGDIVSQSIKLKIGNGVIVKGTIKRDEKFITKTKNSGVNSYENNFEILAQDLEQAKMIKEVLTQLVKPSEAELIQRLPRAKTSKQMLALLSKQFSTISGKSTTLTPSLSQQCFSSYAEQENTSKSGKINTSKSLFNFSHLDANSISLKASGNRISIITPTTERKKYIQRYKDGEQTSYNNKLSLSMGSVEQARIARIVLPQLIKKCHMPITAENMSWLKKNIAQTTQNIPRLSQSLEQKNKKKCAVIFESISNKKDTSEKKSYHFSLSDINPNQVEVDISGKKISVELRANFQEKAIQFSSGEKSKYVSSLQIEQTSVSSALKAAATLKALAAHCNPS